MIINSVFMVLVSESSFFIALFFFFLLLIKPSYRSASIFSGVLFLTVSLIGRLFFWQCDNIIISVFSVFSYILIYIGITGKNGIVNFLTKEFAPVKLEKSPSSSSYNFKINQLKKKKSFFLTGSSNLFFFPILIILQLLSILLAVSFGFFEFIKGSVKKNPLQRWFGLSFLYFGLGELLWHVCSKSPELLYLVLTSFFFGQVILIFSIWKKAFLNFRIRFFLTTLLISFLGILITSILFLGIEILYFPLLISHLGIILSGTISLMALLFFPCWFAAKSFARPISEIIAQTESLRQGKLVPFESRFSNIDYNNLIDALNIMVRAIDKNREDLESQITQLKELDRLREEFLSNISHELRTPLTMIIGNTELILGGLIGDITEEQEEFLQPVFDEAQKLLQLITDVLNFSKIERGVFSIDTKLIDIQETVNTLLKQYEHLAKHRQIEIIKEVPSLKFGTDPSMFNQILNHLLSNATKFNAKGGKVRIRVRKKTPLNDVPWIEIQVADTGIGIRPEILPTIFNKFLQGDGSATREFGGTGIGLTIAKNFVELLGGTIEVKSVVGKGTQFTVKLPSKEVEKLVEQSPQAASEISTFNKETNLIVLIEADKHIAKLLKTYLVQDGYNALAITSGTEALKQLHRLSPSLICFNPNLSDINGWELLKKIRSKEESRNIPVIVVTSLDNRELGKKLGVDDYIILPTKRHEFLSKIQQLLNINQT